MRLHVKDLCPLQTWCQRNHILSKRKTLQMQAIGNQQKGVQEKNYGSEYGPRKLYGPLQDPYILKTGFPSILQRVGLHLLPPKEANDESFSINEARKFLNSHDFAVTLGHTSLKIECPDSVVQPKTLKSQRGHSLYINSKTGYCVCPNCKLHGPWTNLKSYLARLDSKSNLSPFLESYKLKELATYEQQLSTSQLITAHTFKTKLKHNLINLRVETFEKSECRLSETNNILIPVRHLDSSIIVYREIDISSGSEVNLKNTFVPLILPQKGAKDLVVITWNLPDALYAYQETKSTVICLPSGLDNLPIESLPYFEEFSKLVLWFGGGVHEWEAARLFAKKLNEKKCFFVRPSVTSPGPTVAAIEGLDLVKILKTHVSMFHNAVTTFSSLKEEVYAEIVQINEIAGVKWKRFTKLNELMKGFRRGELTIFTGPTGAGKTTFISEYSLDVCMQKVNTLWGSFEIRNVRLAKMMLTQFAGIPLEAEPENFNKYADEFEKLPLYFLTFHGQQDLKSVMEAINHATYVYDIGHVIIDNLQFMMGTGIGSSDRMDMLFLQDRIIGAFRQFATVNNVHVTLVIHPRKEDVTEELTTASIFGSAKATQEADNVLILQDRKILHPGGRKKYIQIAKNRFSGDLGIVPLSFDRESLSFTKKKNAKIASTWALPLEPSIEDENESHRKENTRRRKSKITNDFDPSIKE
ncbi:mitochondrial DNA helicase-like isoform X1 [Artemia franciscana]|uniref:mitochondrial DNA helicase-like isoform X1 n=1 Tax=Artemia franciscana TaxID=6661 RepID=UPI0032DA80BB